MSADKTRILVDNRVYDLYEYRDERELEKLVIENWKAVFGSRTLYFDIKQKVATKAKTRITDGLLLDLSNYQNPQFWIVEYELSRHDVYREVEPQLRGFIRALSSEDTLASIRKVLYEEIKGDSEGLNLIKNSSGQDIDLYYFLDDVLHTKCGLIIVIDEITPQLEELVDELSQNYNVRPIQFETYASNSHRIFRFPSPLTKPSEQTQIITRTAGQYSIEDHLSQATAETKQLLNKLRSEILKLHGTSEKVSKYWLSYGLGTKRVTVFVYINTKGVTRSFRVLLKPKTYLVDAPDILKKSHSTFAPYYFRVRDTNDVIRGLELVKQCYNQYKR